MIRRPDLGTNCLPRLSAGDTGSQRVLRWGEGQDSLFCFVLFFSSFFLIVKLDLFPSSARQSRIYYLNSM